MMHQHSLGPGQGRFMQQPSSQQSTEILLEKSFQNPGWPPNFINAENVLDYFCDHGNIFYDRQSDNEQLKMQQLSMQQPLHDMLLQMKGIQFVVAGGSPPLFVICKQRRSSPTQVSPLCYYYVLNGVVYQCPDMYTLMQNRLASAIDPLKNALNQSLEYLRFNVAKGYTWEFKDPPAKRSTDEEEEKKEEDEDPLQVRSNIYQRTRTNQLLQILFEKFPQGTNLEIDYGDNNPSNSQPKSDVLHQDSRLMADGSLAIRDNISGAPVPGVPIPLTSSAPSVSSIHSDGTLPATLNSSLAGALNGPASVPQVSQSQVNGNNRPASVPEPVSRNGAVGADQTVMGHPQGQTAPRKRIPE